MSIIINALNKFGKFMVSVTCMSTILSLVLLVVGMLSNGNVEANLSAHMVEGGAIMMGLALASLLMVITTAALVVELEPRK